MPSKKSVFQPIALLRTSLGSIVQNPVILYPFAIMAAIQIFIIEILFFAPRYPLNIFFGPMIKTMEGERFLHYPYNYAILNKWFASTQMVTYVLLNSFFFGVAVLIIYLLNSGKTMRLRSVFRQALSRYIHLAVAVLLPVVCLKGFAWAYSLVIRRALLIRSTSGKFFMIKQIVLMGAPYFNLFFAVIISVVFAFVVPLIVIEKKKVWAALIDNFKILFSSFWVIFTVVFLLSLVYVPFFMLKTNQIIYQAGLAPEVLGLTIVLGVFLTMVIDALQLTAITTYYLLKKEIK